MVEMPNVSKTVDISLTKRIITDSSNADFVLSGKVSIEYGACKVLAVDRLWTWFYNANLALLKSIIRDLKKDGSVWTNLNCENVEKQNAVYLVKMKIEENQNLIMDFHQCGVKKNV